MSRLYSAACERNRDPILAVLREVFPDEGFALEIAAGTGMHSVHFAAAFEGLVWQPTDVDPGALASIEAWRVEEGTENLRSPIELDVTDEPWPVERADALLNANMIHISPYECTHALFRGAAAVLVEGAPMVLYGPYKIGGEHTAPSNERFDESLRARDPSWGVRDLEAVQELAADAGLTFERRVQMPANNLCVVFRR